jgi:hypothetical protein
MFKDFGTTVTNQNYIQEEIKKRLNSRNAVQSLLSSRLLSKKLQIKTLFIVVVVVVVVIIIIIIIYSSFAPHGA